MQGGQFVVDGLASCGLGGCELGGFVVALGAAAADDGLDGGLPGFDEGVDELVVGGAGVDAVAELLPVAGEGLVAGLLKRSARRHDAPPVRASRVVVRMASNPAIRWSISSWNRRSRRTWTSVLSKSVDAAGSPTRATAA